MTPNALPDYDVLADALREGRPLRPARAYRIRFAQGDLNFHDLDVVGAILRTVRSGRAGTYNVAGDGKLGIREIAARLGKRCVAGVIA